MRYLLKGIGMTFLIPMLLACQPVATGTLPPAATAQIASTGDISEETGAAQTLSPTLSTEDPGMMPTTPLDETTAKMVTLVTQHLAQKLGVAADQILLVEVKPVVWRDAGLGCPKPGVDYIQVQTPGFNIFLEAGGTTYSYHTDQAKRFVLCNK